MRSRRSPYWHLRTALLIFLGLITFGTIGYMIIERLAFLDALYMTVITISTVGYREVVVPSRGGEIFTMIIIISGLATVVYVTTSVVELLLEGRLLEIMGRRKVLKELQDLTGHYIICGYGRVGKQIAKECQARGTSVVIIEKDEAVAEAAMADDFITVKGDAAEEVVLRQAGLERASGLVTGLSSDADNLFVTMTARMIRPDVFIVGRCNSDDTESKLYRAGADRAISPHNVGGRRMAALLLKPLVCDFLDVVSDHDRGRQPGLGVESSEEHRQLLAGPEVQAGRGFVQQQQCRVEHQRPGNLDALLLARREQRELAIDERGAPDHAQQLGGLVPG